MSLEKGKQAHRQLNVWNGLFEARIQIQKAMTVVDNETKKFTEEETGALRDEVVSIFTRLADLQREMLETVTDIGEDGNDSGDEEKDDTVSGEGIDENDDEDKDGSASKSMRVLRRWCGKRQQSSMGTSTHQRKRHKQLTHYEDEEENEEEEEEEESVATDDDDNSLLYCMETVAQSHHKYMKKYVSPTVDKWYTKTKLAGGGNKNFKALDQSLMTTINSITREKQSTSKAFDPTPFYYTMLKEFLEQKASVGGVDPVELSRHILEIDALRNKVKKNVDTRASKGRKLRYEVHKKLSSFMAPVDAVYTVSDEARDVLFSSLFQ
eukprot:m.44815 g.44815  ORF g.44815 m.44815 type:complete len:323 (+) comp10631_c1_seq1:89-1057(+)